MTSIGQLDAMIQAIYEYPRTEPEVYVPDGWHGLLKLKHQHLTDYEKARASGIRITLVYDDMLLEHKLTLVHADKPAEDVSHWLHQPILELRVKRAGLEHIAAKYVTP